MLEGVGLLVQHGATLPLNHMQLYQLLLLLWWLIIIINISIPECTGPPSRLVYELLNGRRSHVSTLRRTCIGGIVVQHRLI